MTRTEARTWLIRASLVITGADFVFFIAAPFVGYPIEWRDAWRMAEIVFPVFLGYLGAAAHFLFRDSVDGEREIVRPATGAQIGLLVRGPVLVWLAINLVALAAFGFANRQSAPVGAGMTVDQLAMVLSASLGLLAATTSGVVVHLFGLPGQPRAH